MRLICRILLPAMLLPSAAIAADAVAQRLDLLERRVNRITDLTLQLDDVRRENRELRGRIESLGHEIEQLKRKQRDLYMDIDQRLSGASGAAGASSGAARAAASGTPDASSATADRAQVEAEYQAAYELLSPQQRRYREAAKAFDAFLNKYPQDPLAANAQYWLGEAHYVSQSNAEALQAFEQVIEKFPTSQKAPGALFKIGRLQQASGKRSAARATFERVLNDYPKSPAAGLAQRQLEQLGK